MKKLLFSALVALLLLSCKDKKPASRPADQPAGSGAVTVIVPAYEFEYRHQNETIFLHRPPALRFYDGYSSQTIGLEEHDYKLSADTVSLYAFVPRATLSVSTESEYFYDYIVSPGDTLLLNYQGDIPSMTLAGHPDYAENYAWQDPRQYPFYEPRYRLRINAIHNYSETTHYYIDYFDKLEAHLDSWQAQDKLSKEVCDLAKKDLWAARTEMNIHKKSYKLQDANWTDFTFKDSTWLYSDYRYLLESYYFDREKTASQLFDTILTDARLDSGTKKYLLYDFLSEIPDEQDFAPRSEQLLALTGPDSVWIKSVRKVAPMHVLDAKEMQLYDSEMQQVDFAFLMDGYKGKVVYIDLWVSWCMPCRAAMPAAKKLRDAYADKDVVFLYLAWQEREKPWKELSAQFGLSVGNAHSYLIASPEAAWIREIDLQTIPRYILYDKKGTMVSKNAPAPEGTAVRQAIDGLL